MRDSGFYWIRLFPKARPEVGYWNGDSWQVCGSAEPEPDDGNVQVVGNRLIPPGDPDPDNPTPPPKPNPKRKASKR